MFSKNDLEVITNRGSDIKTINEQINHFKHGFPFLQIVKAATKEEGITVLNQAEIELFSNKYDRASASIKVVKFVPASGAASRMFKDLFTFLDEYGEDESSYQKFTDGNEFESVYQLFKQIEHFAFYKSLKNSYESLQGQSFQEGLLKRKYKDILSVLLVNDGLGYGQLPKGLLEFHEYSNSTRTALDEHLVEGALYAKSTGNKVCIHFTVSPEHQSGFDKQLDNSLSGFENDYNVQYEISFSEQKKYTDTIAVDINNEPFREQDGSLLFRPGGHGALIENLNEIDADIIFIKNIDNVVPDRLKASTISYKKALAGLLLQVQKKVFNYLKALDTGNVSDTLIAEMMQFINSELGVIDNNPLVDNKNKLDFIRRILNRPIRVCGMVKNEGEPGGGPFFAMNPDGTVSLQIAESSQIDSENQEQQDILNNATHFNPVDLIVAVKNYRDEKFDLKQFIDHNAGFISNKSKNGKELRALELPGLWNGAMSDWNTLFVEVDLETFNPVKTVNDLIRQQHQPKR